MVVKQFEQERAQSTVEPEHCHLFEDKKLLTSYVESRSCQRCCSYGEDSKILRTITQGIRTTHQRDRHLWEVPSQILRQECFRGSYVAIILTRIVAED